MTAFGPERSVREIVGQVRAIRYWIDEQIKAGLSDDEIVALAPVAIGFINGDISVTDLVGIIDEARRCST